MAGIRTRRTRMPKEQEEAFLAEFPTGNVEDMLKRYGFTNKKCMYSYAERRGMKRDGSMTPKLISEVLRTIRKSERRRADWGLPQKTRLHLPVNPYTRKQQVYRHKLFRKGYILGDYRASGERLEVFYDEETQRSRVIERNASKAGLRIKSIEEAV